MMNLDEKKVEIEWYDNPTIVTNLLIFITALIIIFSQSFAVHSNMSAIYILGSIMNHNSTYLLTLVYFCALKFTVGKRYFNFLNVFLILLYFLIGLASIFTIFQSFSFYTLLSLALHVIFLLYLIHTFLRGTRVWKEFKLVKSPFNEISNDGYFYSIMILAIILLAVNLISTTGFDGTVLTLFDCIYIILFARYVYLYSVFLDMKEKKNKIDKEVRESNKAADKLVKDSNGMVVSGDVEKGTYEFKDIDNEETSSLKKGDKISSSRNDDTDSKEVVGNLETKPRRRKKKKKNEIDERKSDK